MRHCSVDDRISMFFFSKNRVTNFLKTKKNDDPNFHFLIRFTLQYDYIL